MPETVENRFQDIELERMQIVKSEGPCVAFACVAFRLPAGRVVVDNMRLIDRGPRGMFVAMPDYKKGETYYHYVTLRGEIAGDVQDLIVAAYRRKTAHDNADHR